MYQFSIFLSVPLSMVAPQDYAAACQTITPTQCVMIEAEMKPQSLRACLARRDEEAMFWAKMRNDDPMYTSAFVRLSCVPVTMEA